MTIRHGPIAPLGQKIRLDFGDEEPFDGEEVDEDHGIVKALIEDLRHLPSNSHERHNILLVLREAIVNHMKEEEDQLIPVARIKEDLSQLGIKMRAEQDLVRKLKEI